VQESQYVHVSVHVFMQVVILACALHPLSALILLIQVHFLIKSNWTDCQQGYMKCRLKQLMYLDPLNWAQCSINVRNLRYAQHECTRHAVMNSQAECCASAALDVGYNAYPLLWQPLPFTSVSTHKGTSFNNLGQWRGLHYYTSDDKQVHLDFHSSQCMYWPIWLSHADSQASVLCLYVCL